MNERLQRARRAKSFTPVEVSGVSLEERNAPSGKKMVPVLMGPAGQPGPQAQSAIFDDEDWANGAGMRI